MRNTLLKNNSLGMKQTYSSYNLKYIFNFLFKKKPLTIPESDIGFINKSNCIPAGMSLYEIIISLEYHHDYESDHHNHETPIMLLFKYAVVNKDLESIMYLTDLGNAVGLILREDLDTLSRIADGKSGERLSDRNKKVYLKYLPIVNSVIDKFRGEPNTYYILDPITEWNKV